jgi:RNA polymerase sigma-70 factor (ECF subfamily)
VTNGAVSSDQIQDHELLARIATGDLPAFAELFRRRQADVYRFALHMTASSAVADDVTQDVFMAVMRDPGRYDPARATVAAWLCGIARNHVRRRFERDRPTESLSGDDGAFGLELPAVIEDPVADLTRAARLETLRRSILSLPLLYREVVVLCDLQELSYADAAEALGCAVGTVRSRLHRGRALLAEKVRAADEQPGRFRFRGARCFA